MQDLIVRPDGPGRGFIQGAVVTASGAGLPIILIMLIRFWGPAGWRSLGVTVPLALVISLVGGLAVALWRLVQCWAYDKISSGPES